MLEQQDILILCHKYPDGDTIGSAFALCRALLSLGKRANVMCGDILPTKFNYIYSDLEPQRFSEKFIVAVDVADPALLGVLEKDYGSRVDLCIDHHMSNKLYAKQTLLDDEAAAAGEVVYSMLAPLGAALTKEIAIALYTAICTDTGCFRYSNVRARTHRIAAKLIETGIDFHNVNRTMFDTKTRARLLIERELFDSLDYRMGGRLAMMTLTQDMIERTGATESDIDGLSAIPRSIEGVQVGVLMREVGKTFKLSVRTNDGIDASAICVQLGGGGHTEAAGCVIKGSLEQAKDIFYDIASKAIIENE